METKKSSTTGNITQAVVILLAFIIVGAVVFVIGTNRVKRNLNPLQKKTTGSQKMDLNTFQANFSKNLMAVNLTFDKNKMPNLTINHITKRIGYIAPYVSYANGYELDVLDGQGKVIDKRLFVVPNQILYDQPKSTDGGGTIELTQETFNIDFLYKDNASTLRLIGQDKKVIMKKPIGKLAQAELSDMVATLFVPDLVEPLFPFAAPAIAQELFPDCSQLICVLFIPNGYDQSELDQFHQAKERMVATLQNYEPFHARWHLFAFPVIDTLFPFTCDQQLTSVIGTTLPDGCNPNQVIDFVNKANIPYTVLVAITKNNSGYAATAKDLNFIQIPGNIAPEAFTHEMGHAIAKLWDEYVYIDKQTPKQGDPNAGVVRNCYAVPDPVFKPAYKGCTFANWWRTSPTSIMSMQGNNIGPGYVFNQTSQLFLNLFIDYYANFSKQPVSCNNSPAFPCANYPIGLDQPGFADLIDQNPDKDQTPGNDQNPNGNTQPGTKPNGPTQPGTNPDGGNQSPKTGSNFTIGGRVIDSNTNQPMTGIQVYVTNAHNNAQSVVSGQDGSYTLSFTNAETGSYTLCVTPPAGYIFFEPAAPGCISIPVDNNNFQYLSNNFMLEPQ